MRGLRSLASALLLLSGVQARAAEPVAHAMDVTLRGPLAAVEVTRSFRAGPRDQHATEAVVDLPLPEKAVLLEVTVQGAERSTPATFVPPETGRDRYLTAAASRGVTPAAVPFDDAAQLRLRVVVPAGGTAPVQVRYRMSVLLTPVGGDRLALRLPAALDEAPLPVDVTVRAEAVPGQQIDDITVAGATTPCAPPARRCEAHGGGGPRSGWELSYAVRDAHPGSTGAGHELRAVAAAAPGLVAAVVQHRAEARLTPPEHVLLVVDRSHSVGLGGLAAERDVAHHLLERLPPHTRFDALFFARDVLRLFSGPRTATRQALSLIDEAMVPAHMANGTDLAGALRETSKLLESEAGQFGPRVLVVLITDGALPEGQDAAALGGLLRAPAGVQMQVMVLSVRTAGEDAVPAAARRTLQAIAAGAGGVERELDPRDLAASVDGALAALARGGDATSVRLRSAAGDLPWTDQLAPGSSLARAAPLAGRRAGRLRFEGRADGQPFGAALEAVSVDAAVLRPHIAPPASPGLWLAASAGQGAVVLLEPVQRPAAAAFAEPRGTLERSVARDALALAYLPRARACYQTRPTATPAERDLAGRVRLAIDVNRGEITRSAVESSSLQNQRVERCLTEAVWSIEMPRAYHNDQWITAVLNLVFRQRPVEQTRAPGAGVGPQIDLILEELHREPSGGTATGGAQGAPAPAGEAP